ncbi:hypothetical protein evm_005135 [Chilo suppressalis]|nr:hypothetical protein evm_005135 [Chilo suppressalis]
MLLKRNLNCFDEIFFGKVTSGANKLNKKTIDREALLDALTVLYDECNEDPVKKSDELVRAFVDKYRSTLAELRRTRVCYSDFDILQTIGRGHFGEVHLVREKETSDVYALKTLRKEQARKRAAGAAEDERDVLANASGPWIPKLQYAFQDHSNLYLVMELCSGGDLAGLMARRNHPLSERDAAFYVVEICHALKTLHSMGYVHRDVKPHNILLDRCGHVKLADFGSCARLSEGGGGCSSLAVGTADYVAPELLAAADCARRHTVCQQYCRAIVTNAITACDYWSLGVVAFELVTLKRPFSSGDEDSIAEILANIQKYERDPESQPSFDPSPNGPSNEWRALVAGLLRVTPAKRYSYLDTLQHAALAHTAMHSIREQAPPWVPRLRGAEDASYFSVEPRASAPPSAAPFRSRPPFAGQLPFVGYSYVALEENDDSTGGFNASHDCTAIDLATFKSAEKLAIMRGREVASLQSKLAAAEAATGAEAERTRREAEAEAERTRARLQAEITALSLQNRRLERQVEVEKEERMALQRTNQELSTGIAERNASEVHAARAQAASLQSERDVLKEDLRRLEARIAELQGECARATAAADTARTQHQHYRDSVAKERALRRQTLGGGEAENRELAARVATAEATATRETRARENMEKRLADLEDEYGALQAENAALLADLDAVKKDFKRATESANEKHRLVDALTEQLKDVQQQVTQDRVRIPSLLAQVQELEQGLEEAARREAALEEQCSRTEARLRERLEAADARVTAAVSDEARHREKVNTLEQLVRRLEREVSSLENRVCGACAARSMSESGDNKADAHSDTESLADAAHAQLALLKEQLGRAERQLQARSEEIATLKQECRTANLARWRKEREYNDLSTEAKSTARDLKRAEERLAHAQEARKTAEQKAIASENEITTMKPQYERASKEVVRLKERLEKLQKTHETAQAEVDRSRNDIRKLKSELQYSEKRRMHAEEQEELSSRERTQLRDELHQARAQNTQLTENNKALQEACSLLEEQLTDLEKLTDIHELKSKDLEAETQRLRSELEGCRSRLMIVERQAVERDAAATLAEQQHIDARDMARQTHCQLQLLREESSALRTRAHDHHSHALQLQASLADAQEEAAAAREAAEAAAAWWRTRETKADATLRQQAKLIDFLQAKVEEAGRKKCSLSNKLFGRSGRRSAASPPLRRANRELREEVERLRAQLAKRNGETDYPPFPGTPKREKPKTEKNKRKSIDTPDGPQDNNALQIIWADGTRDRVRGRYEEGSLILTSGERTLRAMYVTDHADLPYNEAARAFTVKVDSPSKSQKAAIVCPSVMSRSEWVARLKAAPVFSAAPPASYLPLALVNVTTSPSAGLYVAPDAVAIGCADGLHSLRGPVRVEYEGETYGSRESPEGARIRGVASAAGRALLLHSNGVFHTPIHTLASALRRAQNLHPVVQAVAIRLPDNTTPHLLKVAVGSEGFEGACAAVACGRRVFLLRFDAAATEFKIARSLTVDRPPSSILLTRHALYIAGEKPLRINLPAGALEAFGIDEPIVAAAARKHSPPRAILLIRQEPIEILLCYAECGVFVDEHGKRTRNEDPKWSTAVHAWEFVEPFLYIVGDEKITILYINEDVYRAPPCTCDTSSLASTASECYLPEIFSLKIKEPVLLGTTPNGILVGSVDEEGYKVSIVEGITAFRSVGASVESLETISDSKSSSTDLGQSVTDLSPHEVSRASQDSVEATTGFLADIRKRARQLRNKNRKDQTPDDVIKEILTTEVGLMRTNLSGRKSPASVSEFDSDSTESEEKTASSKCTNDICAEMFTRRVSPIVYLYKLTNHLSQLT